MKLGLESSIFSKLRNRVSSLRTDCLSYVNAHDHLIRQIMNWDLEIPWKIYHQRTGYRICRYTKICCYYFGRLLSRLLKGNRRGMRLISTSRTIILYRSCQLIYSISNVSIAYNFFEWNKNWNQAKVPILWQCYHTTAVTCWTGSNSQPDISFMYGEGRRDNNSLLWFISHWSWYQRSPDKRICSVTSDDL